MEMITISHGVDKTGNINKLENIMDFKNNFIKKKADFVSGDGGIDTDKKKEIQEQVSSQLLFNQIVTALSIQKKKGCCVIKCYSIMTRLTLDCIFILTLFYEEVYITKPVTSKITNHEHYLVCKYYKESPECKKILEKLYEITKEMDNNKILLKKYDKTLNKNKNKNKNKSFDLMKFKSFLDFELPKNFMKKIKDYNVKTLKYYYQTCDDIFDMIENKPDKKELQTIANRNEKIAIEWCKEYNIPFITP